MTSPKNFYFQVCTKSFFRGTPLYHHLISLGDFYWRGSNISPRETTGCQCQAVEFAQSSSGELQYWFLLIENTIFFYPGRQKTADCRMKPSVYTSRRIFIIYKLTLCCKFTIVALKRWYAPYYKRYLFLIEDPIDFNCSY